MNYDSIDLALTTEGDFSLNGEGDLHSTIGDVLLGILQSVGTRVKYPAGSWKLYPNLGVRKLPIGELNIPETAKEWESNIISALTAEGMILPGDLQVQTAPLGPDTLLTLINLKTDPSRYNGGTTQLKFYAIFDSATRQILFY